MQCLNYLRFVLALELRGCDLYVPRMGLKRRFGGQKEVEIQYAKSSDTYKHIAKIYLSNFRKCRLCLICSVGDRFVRFRPWLKAEI